MSLNAESTIVMPWRRPAVGERNEHSLIYLASKSGS